MVFRLFRRGVSRKAFLDFRKSLEKSLLSSFSNIKRDNQRTERTINELSAVQNEQSVEMESFKKTLAGIKRKLRSDVRKIRTEITEEIMVKLDLESRMPDLKIEILEEAQQQFVKLLNEHSIEQQKAKSNVPEPESIKSEVFVDRSSVRHRHSSSVRQPPNNEHSVLHIEILKRLMLLQNSLQLRWISMKDLASELYPGRTYRRVKSTLSEYLTELHKAGLVEKRYQRRNRLFISYTEKALKFAENGMITKMKRLISEK